MRFLMDKEIEVLKKEIEELKKQLQKRPTKEQMEAFVKDFIVHNVPLI